MSNDEEKIAMDSSDKNEETKNIKVDELTELREKLETIEDQNLRLQAEIQNMRRRNKINREESARYRSQDLAREILPALDNLERALATEVTDEAGKNLKQGVEMVLDGFNRALSAAHVEEIEAIGKEFDPNIHEALAQIPAEEGQESGIVTEVYEKGYKLHDRVLRAAKVIVTE
ncbi:MAG: nucleotide exchange factor GrpE [Atopostipes suicloacalis]|nr:nucleotide exchange factor GrpE [Atopostipes suicloacalis]